MQGDEVGILTPSGFGEQFGIDNTAQTRIRGGTFNPQTEMADVFKTLNTATPTEVEQTFIFTDPNTGQPLEDGRTITTREGDGMVDLLGDTRLLQDFETRTATAEGVSKDLLKKSVISLSRHLPIREERGLMTKETSWAYPS